MKFVAVLSLLLMANSAFAFRQGYKKQDGRRARAVEGHSNLNRDLKSGSSPQGMEKKGMKASSKRMKASSMGMKASSKSMKDSSKGMEDSSKSMKASSKSMKASSKSMKDSSKSMKDSSKSMKDSSKSMKDSSKSMKASSKSMKASSKSMKASSKSMKASSKSMKASSKSMKASSKGMKASSKGMMNGGGMEKKSMKASSKGMMEGGSMHTNGCIIKKTKSLFAEIEAGFSETASGSTLIFPIYDYETSDLIGSYVDQNTNVFFDGFQEDCVFTGSYNFDFDDSLDFPFASQLSIAATCLGTTNSITGGTGSYACATGYETFIEGDDEFFVSELTICNTCAY